MDLLNATRIANELYNENPSYHNTCHIDRAKNGCFVYATNSALHMLPCIDKDVIILAPEECRRVSVRVITLEDPFLVFTILHNKIWKKKKLPAPLFYTPSHIDQTTIISSEGLRFAKAACGTLIPFKHVGSVIISREVFIGPFCHIQRGTFGNTVLHKGVKLGPHVSIGHGATIGLNTIVTAGTHIGGSTSIGPNCFLGIGSSVRNSIEIAANTMVGMGSVVVRDIKAPHGVYYGNPAERQAEWDGSWVT